MQMAFTFLRYLKQRLKQCRSLQQYAARMQTLRHLGEGSWVLRSDLSLRHFGSSAKLSGQFGPARTVQKCLGSEVSRVRSVWLLVQQFPYIKLGISSCQDS